VDGAREILGPPPFRCGCLQAERADRRLDLVVLQDGAGIDDIGQDRQPAETGKNLAQEFKAFACEIGKQDRKAGDVATWSRKVVDNADADWVSYTCEDDWNARCSLLYRQGRSGCRGRNDIHLEPDELSRNLGEALAASCRPAILNGDVAPLDPAEFAQSPHQCGKPLAMG